MLTAQSMCDLLVANTINTLCRREVSLTALSPKNSNVKPIENAGEGILEVCEDQKISPHWLSAPNSSVPP